MCVVTGGLHAQEFNKKIDKDSLFQVILKRVPEHLKQDLVETYNSGTTQSKEFLLFMLADEPVSKNDIIQNITNNFRNIAILKEEFKKLVPENTNVSIEFNPKGVLINTNESIDIRVSKVQNGSVTTVYQEWGLEHDAPRLRQILDYLKWDHQTLLRIKELLKNAKCISITNGEMTTIGFARSGMGKYSFNLFDHNLTEKEIEAYNDGCTYIFYKDNIVLEYGGGAVGRQCFPED